MWLLLEYFLALTHLLKDIQLEWCHKSGKVLTRLEGWIIQWWLHFCGIILSIIIAAGFALACWRGESGALWGAISISQWYQVTVSAPKYSLNDGRTEGKALTWAETKHKTIFLHMLSPNAALQAADRKTQSQTPLSRQISTQLNST